MTRNLIIGGGYIGLGAGNAIRVDRHMATQTRDIWAAGDCVQTWHHLRERHVYMPLGTTAHMQGRVKRG